VTAVRVTAQITLFGAGLADSQQTKAGAHIGGSRVLAVTNVGDPALSILRRTSGPIGG
jgi:hypothetical protein